MNSEELLLRTLDDLSLRINSRDEYEVLLASTLIRKLFLDDYPLIDQVNKNYKLKFEFEFVKVEPPNIPGVVPTYWSAIESLDPFLSPAHAKTIKTNREKFFGSVIGIAEGHQYTIREIIKFAANVMGGIHAGVPKTAIEEALNKLREFYLFSELSIPLQQIKSISRIILRTLKPLKYKILNYDKFENQKGVSIHIALTLLPSKENHTNFIFDIGIEENKNRLSIYISNNHELFFQLHDDKGRIFKVNAGHAGSSFIYGNPIYISCEIASLEQEIMLSIDTGTWNYSKIFNTSVELSFLEKLHFVMGSSYNGKELTNMSLMEQALYSRALKIEEKEKLQKYFLDNIRKGYEKSIRFEGNQFLHSEHHPNFVK